MLFCEVEEIMQSRYKKRTGRYHHKGTFSGSSTNMPVETGDPEDHSSATIQGMSPSFKTTVMDHPYHYFFS